MDALVNIHHTEPSGNVGSRQARVVVVVVGVRQHPYYIIMHLIILTRLLAYAGERTAVNVKAPGLGWSVLCVRVCVRTRPFARS